MGVAATVAKLKAANEDFEWYPTTQKMIDAVVADFYAFDLDNDIIYQNRMSLLDVGAGDGRVLLGIRDGFNAKERNHKTSMQLYGIEVAELHITNMPRDVAIVGTDFYAQTLVDKNVTCVFTNPPYSEYESWMHKLLREVNASVVYAIMPRRWRASQLLDEVLTHRKPDMHVVGEFDFEDGDRAARAKVDIVRFYFYHQDRKHLHDRMVEELLPELKSFDQKREQEQEYLKQEAEALLVYSGDIVTHLVAAYDASRQNLVDNYTNIAKLSPGLLETLGVSKSALIDGVWLKLTGLKAQYWTTLFDEMKAIRTRLATKQRKGFLDTLELTKATDFTVENIRAVLAWVCKHASSHFDAQLCDLFVSLSDFCNVELYKSNKRVWDALGWGYLRYDEIKDLQDYAFKLGYRIVTHRSGGLKNDKWFEMSYNGLCEAAYNLLSDVVTVANNLGFSCEDSPKNYTWESNKKVVFKLDDGRPLVAVRAFKNRNMHLHFNEHFMLKLNTEAGRLLGWLRSPEHAAEEIAKTDEERAYVRACFGEHTRLPMQQLLGLGLKS